MIHHYHLDSYLFIQNIFPVVLHLRFLYKQYCVHLQEIQTVKLNLDKRENLLIISAIKHSKVFFIDASKFLFNTQLAISSIFTMHSFRRYIFSLNGSTSMFHIDSCTLFNSTFHVILLIHFSRSASAPLKLISCYTRLIDDIIFLVKCKMDKKI